MDAATLRLLRERGTRVGRYDEVWNGVLKMSPGPGWDHQAIVHNLEIALHGVVQAPGLGRVFPGLNVSPFGGDWEQDFRISDICVYLAGNPAVFHEAHVQGGPDLVVEIVSPGQNPHDKVEFYAAVGTRELLIVDRRRGWAFELLRLDGGVLTPAGRAEPGVGAVTSESVGLTFRLEPAEPRPAIVAGDAAGGRE